jgi:probable rRNA maturation factor
MEKRKQSMEMLPFLTSSIEFNNIDSSYVLNGKRFLKSWIEKTIKTEKLSTGNLSFNFCSDEYLLQVNRDHLNHDYYTDIITFDFCENKTVSGDIYISIDRVKENAKTEHKTTTNELCRVIIHGVLHLCGYKDKKPADARLMRQKEDYYLSLLP